MSVLNLGQRVVLMARLAAVEHVRLELADEALVAARRESLVGDEDFAAAVGDEPAARLTRPVGDVLGEVFKRLETRTRMPRVKPAGSPTGDRAKVRGAA